MAKKKVKGNSKRILLMFLVCSAINAYIVYSVGSVLKDAYVMKSEEKQLTQQLEELKEEEEELKVEVNKLQDPEYVAKYAREKYLYSGKGEYIIRIK